MVCIAEHCVESKSQRMVAKLASAKSCAAVLGPATPGAGRACAGVGILAARTVAPTRCVPQTEQFRAMFQEGRVDYCLVNVGAEAPCYCF
eukprot:14839033-Alexandrium_andersonii.AAC.1